MMGGISWLENARPNHYLYACVIFQLPAPVFIGPVYRCIFESPHQLIRDTVTQRYSDVQYNLSPAFHYAFGSRVTLLRINAVCRDTKA